MNININPDDIDNYVKEAILKSTFGGALKQEIEKAVKSLGDSWNSPFKGLIQDTLREIAKEYLNMPENKEAIQEAVARVITPKAIEDMLEYGLEKLQKEIQDYNT